MNNEELCEVNPSPLYTNVVYSVVTPGQSEYPPDYMPGWDTKYPASQVAWQPNPEAPECLKNSDIKTMDDWITWLHTNIIDVLCTLHKFPCHWIISGTVKPIGESIAECLKMTTDNNTIVFDSTNKTAIAGTVINESNCSQFTIDTKLCVIDATLTDNTPIHILGTTDTNVEKPYWFKITLPETTKMLEKIGVNLPNNAKGSLVSGERHVPLSEIEILGVTKEGNTYNSTTGTITIKKEGFYRITFSAFNKSVYPSMTPGITAFTQLLAGLLVESGSTFAREEIRLYQQPWWRDTGTEIVQCVKYTYANFFNVGSRITPRIWYAFNEGSITSAQLNVSDGNSQLTLVRVHDRTFD